MMLMSRLTGLDGRNVRILVVDDDAPIRRLLSALIRRGLDGAVEIREVSSGEDALAALREGPFDLVLSDYRMGAVNGVDVLESAAVRMTGAARVLITGYADVPVAVDGVNRGQMDGFVTKPWDNERLVALIERVLERTRERRASDATDAEGAT